MYSDPGDRRSLRTQVVLLDAADPSPSRSTGSAAWSGNASGTRTCRNSFQRKVSHREATARSLGTRREVPHYTKSSGRLRLKYSDECSNPMMRFSLRRKSSSQGYYILRPSSIPIFSKFNSPRFLYVSQRETAIRALAKSNG